MKRTNFLTKALILLTLVLLQHKAMAQNYSFKVIVNVKNQVNSLTKEEVSRLFLKKTTKWSFNETARPVDHSYDSKVRNEFTKQIIGKTVPSVKNYWQNKIFSGREVPPPAFDSDAKVIEYVQKNVYAIGYISSNTKTISVKVLEIK